MPNDETITIQWHMEIGLVGAERDGEVEVPANATEDEIDAAVREDVLGYVEWSWRKKE